MIREESVSALIDNEDSNQFLEITQERMNQLSCQTSQYYIHYLPWSQQRRHSNNDEWSLLASVC